MCKILIWKYVIKLFQLVYARCFLLISEHKLNKGWKKSTFFHFHQNFIKWEIGEIKSLKKVNAKVLVTINEKKGKNLGLTFNEIVDDLEDEFFIDYGIALLQVFWFRLFVFDCNE